MGENVAYALVLTLFAGLATGVGSAIAFFARTTNRKFLSFALGLSAGVMIYVSFMELLYQSRIELAAISGEKEGTLVTVIAFFGGMLIAALIDKAVPSFENPHEIRSVEDMSLPVQGGGDESDGKGAGCGGGAGGRKATGGAGCGSGAGGRKATGGAGCKSGRGGTKSGGGKDRLSRMGFITAIALAVHNFPEGIATFMSAVEQPQVGLAIAVAVAIHNIPEGIAVSVPIYYATGSRRKAFWYSFMSGLAEPLGAMLAWLVLMPFMSPMLLYCSFAAVAGIMVFISIDELLPAAHEYGEYHISIYGLVTGMGVMAISLILLM